MKQRWLEVIFAGVVFSFAGLDGVAADRRIRAGFATADLTPLLGLEMGGFGMNLERKGEAVHDSLLARAVVLELDHRKVAIPKIGHKAFTPPSGSLTPMMRNAPQATTIRKLAKTFAGTRLNV